MSPRIPLDHDRIAAFCRRWRVAELSLFGSVVRDDFRPDSDVDVLVLFDPDAVLDITIYEDMRAELAEMFGRPVDVVPKKWLRPRMREAVLREAMVVYAA